MDATSNKLERQQILVAAMRKLLPLPCGCRPRVVACGCEGRCECALDLQLCLCAGESGDADWVAAWDSFAVRLAEFFRTVDPYNYADRSPPRVASAVISTEQRIELYAARAAMGFGIFDTAHDLHAGETKAGEGCVVGMNGTARRTGAQAEPDVRFREAWRSTAKGA